VKPAASVAVYPSAAITQCSLEKGLSWGILSKSQVSKLVSNEFISCQKPCRGISNSNPDLSDH